jgi:micrococcal nuclease
MLFLALACTLIAVDGDTLRCGEERIRLIGIDAPELPGHCQEERSCAPGDPMASMAALAAASRGTAEIDRQGYDRYDRTLARVRVNGVDLSCRSLPAGTQFTVLAGTCSVRSGRNVVSPSRLKVLRVHLVGQVSAPPVRRHQRRGQAGAIATVPRLAGLAPLRCGAGNQAMALTWTGMATASHASRLGDS